MKKFTKLLSALVLALIALLLLSTPALAIAEPTSGPTIESVHVYRHCLEQDDTLIVVQYYLDYADPPGNPTETINQAFLGRFMDGTSELDNVAPYAYYDKGYDHGVFSMYLGASEAPAWEGSYSVRFEGNPLLSWPGDPPSATTTTLNWHSTTTKAATELLLTSQIMSIANALSNYWSVALVTETASGPKLSGYGQQYFVNAIPNLRTICPGAFPASVEAPIYEPAVYTQAYRDTLLSRLDGTMLGNALVGLAGWTTIPLTVVKAILWFILMLMVAYFASIATKDLRVATFLMLPLIPLGNLLGMLSLTFTIVGTLFCVLAIGYALFYKPSAG